MTIRSRREFLGLMGRLAGAGLACERLGLVHALAQSGAGCEGYKALVCVFLFGGNDAANTVIPVRGEQTYADYARVRGPLALAEDQLHLIQTRQGGTVYGLHPRLSDLRTFYEQGRLAVVLNVGTLVAPMTRDQYRRPGAVVPANLFSHSDQQAQWQTSTPSTMTPTGWGGRIADRSAQCNAPATFPVVLSVAGNQAFGVGEQTRLATLIPNATMGLQGFGQTPNPRFNAYRRLLEFDNGLALVQAANRTAEAGIDDAELINRALAAPTGITTAFPDTPLGRQLRTVARIIEVRGATGLQRQVFFCSQGGYDTHQNQLGTHDTLLAQLNAAVAAFYNATVELGAADLVTTFTASEFNRTAQANSSNGSDHGWGGHHLVLGGAVKGGDTYGRHPELALGGPDDANVRGVYIPSAGLDQYNATLAAWFGLGPAGLAAVFPNLGNFASPDMGFMG
jgi:uncharacterized protein (DUF1501 family)